MVYGQVAGDSFLNATFQAPGGTATGSFPGYLYPEDSSCVAGGGSTSPSTSSAALTPVTVTSTGSVTGLTTLAPGPSGGPSTVVTFVTPSATPIPPVTITSTATTTGLTTVPPGSGGSVTTVITFVTPSTTSTSISSSCVLASPSTTLSASATASATQTIIVPACATSVSIRILGGDGGQSTGGLGELVEGSLAVTPGQAFTAGGGGAASALYLGTTLLGVAGAGAGAGGSGSAYFSSGAVMVQHESTSSNSGAAGNSGANRYLYTLSQSPPTTYTSLIGGGGAGSATTPESGGVFGGTYVSAKAGTAGNLAVLGRLVRELRLAAKVQVWLVAAEEEVVIVAAVEARLFTTTLAIYTTLVPKVAEVPVLLIQAFLEALRPSLRLHLSEALS
ncbi:hypothetical protein CSAL01_06987 [Colletotrichum salicis]|uniref:Uncharacterized protein n=1 Tax=Colletotrichum salicis TaxID=1209931 RepID=A0A135V897_9PEZI|nr:hypothetical protein CSAL01_06987 [Colletotrichum salicis]